MNDRKNERMKERRANKWMNELITFSKWTRNSATTRTHPLGTQAQRYRPPIRLGCRIPIIHTRAINVHSKYIILPVFSAPEPKAQVHYCDPSSVRPSVRRPSSVVVNFSLFRLFLWNHWREFNNTWQEAISQHPLPSLCFSGRSKKQDGRPGLWLGDTFSTFPLKLLNGIQRNLTGSKISTSYTKFVFFGLIGKTRWPLWPLICWDIFDFSSETAERNSTNFDRKQHHNVLYQVCVFRADRKIRWPPWPLIGWDIFDFSSETVEQIFTKLDRKQDLNVLYQVCVFRADQKIKMTALASDWLRHFRLRLWNRWTELNETWQESRSQRPLPSLCFSGRPEK